MAISFSSHLFRSKFNNTFSFHRSYLSNLASFICLIISFIFILLQFLIIFSGAQVVYFVGRALWGGFIYLCLRRDFCCTDVDSLIFTERCGELKKNT